VAQPKQHISSAAGARDALRNPGLDGLRGFAMLIMFAFHYGGGQHSTNWAVHFLGLATQVGWTGLIIFYALSGFLITGGLWDSLGTRHLLRHFYMRRVLRIFPLYFLALGLAMLVALVRGFSWADLRPFAIYVLYLQNVPPFAAWAAVFPSPLPLYHLWSLAVEEQFYLLWPALVLFSRTRRIALWLSLAIFAISAVFRFVIWGPLFRFAFDGVVQRHVFDGFLLTHAGALALGAALAFAVRGSNAAAITRYAPAAFIAGLLLYGVTSWLGGTLKMEPRVQFPLGMIGVSVAATALVLLVLRPGFAGGFFTLAPLRLMGRISYGFYIFHILLLPLFEKIAIWLTPPASREAFLATRILVAFFITFPLAWLSYHYFEEPILALKRRFPMHSSLPQVSKL